MECLESSTTDIPALLTLPLIKPLIFIFAPSLFCTCFGNVSFLNFRFTNNFGSAGVLDWLHGTDKHFQTSIQCKRHFLTPVHELVPEQNKGKTRRNTIEKYMLHENK